MKFTSDFLEKEISLCQTARFLPNFPEITIITLQIQISNHAQSKYFSNCNHCNKCYNILKFNSKLISYSVRIRLRGLNLLVTSF